MLAQYLSNDETALACDFAETYHVLNWRSLPLRTAATLAAGLRSSSRSAMAAQKVKADLTDSLLAMIHDDLRQLIWQHGGKHAQRPQLIAMDIIHGPKKHDDLRTFDTGEDFLKAWKELNNV